MFNFTSQPVIALTPRKLRLRTTLVLPFVLQIIAAVGLVGYLSFRNGQKAVNDLANQMIQEVGNRVVQHLDADAKACFEQVLAVNPLDKTAKLYLERVQELLLEGAPANWNGVWAFTQK